MSTPPIPRITPEPGSRLDDLLAEFAALKPQLDELTTRLDTVKAGIKAELAAAAPGHQQVDTTSEALAQPLRLSYVESWRLDAKRMKSEDPATYVRYAVKGGRWELRAVSQ